MQYPDASWMKVKSESEVTKSCPTLCDPMDCSLSCSSVHGIFQARVLEWGAISFSRWSSQPRDKTHVSSTEGRFFTAETSGKSSLICRLSQSPEAKIALSTFLHSCLGFSLYLCLRVDPALSSNQPGSILSTTIVFYFSEPLLLLLLLLLSRFSRVWLCATP